MAMEISETISHSSDEEWNQHQSSSTQGQSTECTIPLKCLLGLLKERPTDLSIFKVPYKLRQVNEAAYSPLIVSIGPYHANTGTRSFLWQKLANKRGRLAAKEDGNRQKNMTSLPQQELAKNSDHLLDMEERKLWYMLFFLQRTEDPEDPEKPEKTFDEFRKEIKDLTDAVHRSYAEYIDFGTNELVDMMMVDGCFILELFIRSWYYEDNVHKDDLKSQCEVREDNPYDDDPIFQNSWMLPTLRRDLALLENQIPYFILISLYKIFMKNLKPTKIPPNTSHQKFPSVPLLALSFFRPNLKLKQLTQRRPEAEAEGEAIREKCSRYGKCWHLLDLLHNFYFPTSCEELKKKEEKETSCEEYPASAKSEEPLGFREGATKLYEAGIESVKKSEETWEKNFIKVDFDEKKGDIKIPELELDEITELLLMNLIAYEQCSPKRQYHISSYATLMKSLLRSPTDVELLQSKKIIIDKLGGNKKVLNFFENILMGFVPGHFCFHPLCMQVNAYKTTRTHYHRIRAFCKVRRIRDCRALKDNYCSNSWRIIAVITAFILLCLTVLQAVYTVYPYYVPHR